MPFTVSHAAAVLPLRRTRLIWSALVVGSFGPDFQYFLFMSYDSRSWHYYPDVLRFCLPFTLAAFLLFQATIKKPIAGLLPAALQRRMDFSRSYLPHTPADLLVIFLSLLIGLGTHLLWDAFTHPFTWFWYHLAFMRRPLAYPGEPRGYGYMAAQSLSTTLGLLLLGVMFVLWWRTARPIYPVVQTLSRRVRFAIWGEIIVLTVAGALWRASVIVGWVPSRREYFELIAVISGIAWLCWELLAYGLLLTYAFRRTQKEGAHL